MLFTTEDVIVRTLKDEEDYTCTARELAERCRTVGVGCNLGHVRKTLSRLYADLKVDRKLVPGISNSVFVWRLSKPPSINEKIDPSTRLVCGD